MSAELAREQVGWLTEHLLASPESQLDEALTLFHPAVIGHAVEALPPEERQRIWRAVPPELKGELLLEVSPPVRNQLIAQTDTGTLVSAVDMLQHDELADIERELPDAAMHALLDTMDAERRRRYELLRQQPHDTAGGLMDVDAISVRSDVSIGAVLRYLRRLRQRLGHLPEHSDKLMVVDHQDRFLGTLAISDVASLDAETAVADVMNAQARAVTVSMPATEVAKLFEDRDLISAPVVDADGVLLGRITIDDVVDVIRREADRAVLGRAGLGEHVDLFAPVQVSVKRRAGWLAVHLATAFAAAWVIRLFDASIEQVVALAVLMPVVASMAGVSANQTLTLVTRGLALSQLDRANVTRVLALETRVGAWNGLLWAGIVFVFTVVWYGDVRLGLIFGAAMAVSMLTGAIAGTLIPVAMSRAAIDPAIAGGVVLTGATDVISFGSFLGLATLILI